MQKVVMVYKFTSKSAINGKQEISKVELILNKNKVDHSIAVGNLMFEWTNNPEMRELGILHDIGYGLSRENPRLHNHAGGIFLNEFFHPYWKEVFHHGEVDPPYKSEALDLLNKADLHVDNKGNLVTPEERIADIGERYGKDSGPYKNAQLLARKLGLI